jgi:hypothetical protein
MADRVTVLRKNVKALKESRRHIFILTFDFFETEFGYVVQAGLILIVFLPQSPKCWDYRYVPPCPTGGIIK